MYRKAQELSGLLQDSLATLFPYIQFSNPAAALDRLSCISTQKISKRDYSRDDLTFLFVLGFYLFIYIFASSSHYVTLAGLDFLENHLPLFPKGWN